MVVIVVISNSKVVQVTYVIEEVVRYVDTVIDSDLCIKNLR